MANDKDMGNKTTSGNPNSPASHVSPSNAPSSADPSGKESDIPPAAKKTNEQRPEPNVEPTPTFRADMGEGLPPQKDQLNPDRAK